jgi:hypothetical protein
MIVALSAATWISILILILQILMKIVKDGD